MDDTISREEDGTINAGYAVWRELIAELIAFELDDNCDVVPLRRKKDLLSYYEGELREGIRKGLITRSIFPVFCVCAGKSMGVHRLMEFLGNVVPFVSEMPKLHNTRGEEITPDANGPESVYFFKTGLEPHIGEVSYFKVMSGSIKSGDDLTNTKGNAYF